jgi:hypothetical protein
MSYEIIGAIGALLIAASFLYVAWTVGKSMMR